MIVLTHGYHALAIIIQILLDNLQQALNRPTPSHLNDLLTITTASIRTHFLTAATRSESVNNVAAQVLILLLHLRKRDRQPSHHTFIRDLVDITLHHQPEIENELVALVLWIGNGNGEAEHRVFGVWVVDGDVAVEEGVARDDVLLQDVKVEEAWFWRP